MQIALKDKSGNPVAYDGIDGLRVAGYDNFGNSKTHKYSRMSALNAYAVAQQSDGKYLVKKKLQYIPSDDLFLFALTDADCKELGAEKDDGSYEVVQVLTLKSLTVGNTYAAAEMY